MSAPAPEAPAAAKPYKGPESYQVEDSDLFYGRDREAEQLIAKILSSRFTLVHAQSGAGKTSILNARVIPELEARGWGAFRVLPHNDPVESLRAATLHYVLPPLESELAALCRAASELAPGEDPALGRLLELYDQLDVKDARRRALVRPVASPPPGPGPKYAEAGDAVPYVSRLLRSQVEVECLAEHFGAIWREGAPAGEPPPALDGRVTVGALARVLGHEWMARGYERLFEELNVPVHDLVVFFQNLCEVYGARRSRFALVVILDQFEELFTRFVDPGPAAPPAPAPAPPPGAAPPPPRPPDWRLRKEFFEQFARLYGAQRGRDEAGDDGGEQPAAPSRLPIRYVISMRDEYIAQLDQLRPVVGPFDDVSFHLSLLEREQAAAAISKPAKHFGYSYSQGCYDEIIKQLMKEDRYVEPAHLQLVCERLWNEAGAQLSSLSSEEAGGDNDGERAEKHQVPLGVFQQLGGTAGILKSFFRDFLNELEEEERLEALEMLEPLVTASGTRNIVERSALIDAPFRDSDRRSRILKRMADRTIVRTERRLGGFFVEITHEFLIAPILEAMRETLTTNVEYSRFRWAIRTLERLQTVGRGPGRLLSAQEFETLDEHRHKIRWNPRGTEVMVRSAITHGARRATLLRWLDAYNHLNQSGDVLALLEDRMVREEGRDLLTLADLRLVNGQREGLKLTRPQIVYILRSTLALANDSERDQVMYWTRRLLRHGT